MKKTLLTPFIGLVCCLTTIHSFQAMAQPSMASVPSNGVIVLKDYNYRSWGPELVHYQINTSTFVPGKLVLLGPGGSAIPFQIKGNILSFVASLNKNQTVIDSLKYSGTDRSNENSTLSSQVVGNNLEIGNNKFTLRVPKVQSQTFASPVNISQAPAPFLGIKHAGKNWYGSSRFFTTRKVSSYAFSIIEQGGASITYEARYVFFPEGEYVCKIQVSNNIPYPLFTEEFDFCSITKGEDFLVLDIAAGWSPGTYRYMYSGFGGGESPLSSGAIENAPLNTYISNKATSWNNWNALQPKPYQPGQSMIFLDNVTISGSFGGRAAVGVSSSTQAVYFLPMHGGIWRRAMAATVWNDPSSGVKIALPISVRNLHESTENISDGNPYLTGTHDPGVPASYGRRIWALCCDLADADVANVHQQAGVIGLNRYKNWVLNWNYDGSKTFPRAQTTPALVTRLKNSINSHPEKDKLQTCYIITGNASDATNNANLALNQLRNVSQYYTSFEKNWAFTSYRDNDFSVFIILAEDALSCPSLPSNLRDELRQRLAIWAYFNSEPDMVPLGTGIHLGTMNMRMGRTLSGLKFMSLLPDHPQYDYWMTHYRDWVSYISGTMISVGGAWFEPPLYQCFASRWLATAQAILRNSGYMDYGPKEYMSRLLDYNANITMRDPRYPSNKRILPGMGDGGNTLEGMFGIGQGVVESANNAKGKFFSYMHGLNGINGKLSMSNSIGTTTLPDYSFLYMPDVGSQPGTLTTTYIPGYGVAFRAHMGNADETGMLFRCGYTRSHWAVDDQNVILYSKGAPLSPGYAHQYYSGKADQLGPRFNQCRVVKAVMDPPNGRIHSDVQDYGFGPNADYAQGRMFFSGDELGDGKGDMEWRRHILFMKSSQATGANYFVMRDLFTGFDGASVTTGRTAWWTWLNLDLANLVKVNGVAFNAANVANESVTPESSWPSLTGNTIEMGTNYGASSWFWFDSPATPTLKAVMKQNYTVDPADYQRTFQSLVSPIPTASSAESRTMFRIQGNADEGFFYVLYPRKGPEATPTCTRLAPGVLKIVTSEATDYVFVGGTAFNFNQGGVQFSGKAGSIRVFSDHVVFCMNSGTGTIGYNGYILSGSGPFERSVPNANLTPGTINVGGTAKTMQTVTLGGGMTVRGEGPFTATLNGQEIHMHTDGRARPFVVENLPKEMRHPQFLLDGQQWLCLKNEEPPQGWGTWSHSNGVCFSTMDGPHDIVLRETTYPAPWADLMPSNVVKSCSLTTGVKEKEMIAAPDLLLFPNPAFDKTFLNYSLPKESKVTISVYDLMGKEIMQLINEKQNTGNHQLKFNTDKLCNGIYLVKMSVDGNQVTKKLIVSK